MTTVVRSLDPALARLLEAHEEIAVIEGTPQESLVLDDNGRVRTLTVGDPSCEVSGLVELIDNNPLVCADHVSVPGPVATLALIALGPLVRAGLLLEAPAMQVGVASMDEDVEAFLSREGWNDGIVLSTGGEDLRGVIAANVFALIATPGDWSEIDELYRECYAHSFYVRENTSDQWDVSLVSGKPFALYDLSYSPGEDNSLLTVKVMADRDGKCGAAQIVHAMNVMCGLVESTGIGG